MDETGRRQSAPNVGVGRRSWCRNRWPAACLLGLLAGTVYPQDVPEIPRDAAPPPEVVESAIDLTSIDASLRDAASATVVRPRWTIAPWIVDVYGRNYQDFTNDAASRVISDWLTNGLIDVRLFNIVNRERIRAVLSEKNLALMGMARDAAHDVPENALASAGQLLSVHFILLGNVKNLGTTSEVDFKLLDVETATYSPRFRLNFEAPFNPSIESFKSVIDQIVGELAASFPLEVAVHSVLENGDVVLPVGHEDGVHDGARVELWDRSSGIATGAGRVLRAVARAAVARVDGASSQVVPGTSWARVSIAPGAEGVISVARANLARGDRAAARKLLDEGIARYPAHARLRALHGNVAWSDGAMEIAVASYREALRLEPNDVETLHRAAEVFLQAGQFDEVARVVAGSDAGTVTRSSAIELSLGRAFSSMGLLEQSRDAFRRAASLEPSDARPHIWLAALAAQRRDLREFERELVLARDSGASGWEAGVARSLLVAPLDGPPTWANRLRQDIDAASLRGDIEALLMIGQLVLAREELWELAAGLAERCLELAPQHVVASLLRSQAFQSGGRLEEAVSGLERALERDPDNVTLLVRSGELLSEKGDLELAERRLLLARDQAPEAWRAAQALGDHYGRAGQHLQAFGAYQAALEAAERHGELELTGRWLEVGRAGVLANQHAAAQAYLERCVAAVPDHAECRYFLGLCHFEAGVAPSDAAAIVNLKAAVETHTDAAFYLGALYERRRELDEARNWYLRCIASNCSLRDESRTRNDVVETVSGTIIGQPRGGKQVILGVGRIHGVVPTQIAVVLRGMDVIARVEADEVGEDETRALIRGGEPRTGDRVRFRPARPRDVAAVRGPKRGAVVRWSRAPEPEVVGYEIQRAEGHPRGYRTVARVGARQQEWVDRSAKAGAVYFYRVIARTRHGAMSLPSLEEAELHL